MKCQKCSTRCKVVDTNNSAIIWMCPECYMEYEVYNDKQDTNRRNRA